MVRLVCFVIVLLLFCLCFAFTHANPYSLTGDMTDACFKPSQKATAECLQQLIESYYGKSFTKYCPDFPQVLAESRCAGCPWDRLDPEKINPDIAEEYRAASNTTELFHEPNANCSISEYVHGFGSYEGVAKYVSGWAITGSIPILFSTGAILQYTSGSSGLSRPSFFGWEVHEWMFMGAVWASFNVGIVILSISEDYYRFCDTAASNLSLVITRDLSYVILIYYSLCRCRQLLFLGPEKRRRAKQETLSTTGRKKYPLDASNAAQYIHYSSTSWYTFVSDKEGMPWREYIRSKKAVALCAVYGSSFIIQLLSFAEIYGLSIINFDYEQGPSICSLPSVDVSTRAIAIAKLTFEPLAHIVYSFGSSTRNKVVHCIRYVVLAFMALSCIALLFLMQLKSFYRHYNEVFLVWRVPLWSTVSRFTEISHALVISMFGLLEPLRNGSIY